MHNHGKGHFGYKMSTSAALRSEICLRQIWCQLTKLLSSFCMFSRALSNPVLPDTLSAARKGKDKAQTGQDIRGRSLCG